MWMVSALILLQFWLGVPGSLAWVLHNFLYVCATILFSQFFPLRLWDSINVYGNPKDGDMLTTGSPLGTPPLIDMISNDPILRGVKVIMMSEFLLGEIKKILWLSRLTGLYFSMRNTWQLLVSTSVISGDSCYVFLLSRMLWLMF